MELELVDIESDTCTGCHYFADFDDNCPRDTNDNLSCLRCKIWVIKKEKPLVQMTDKTFMLNKNITPPEQKINVSSGIKHDSGKRQWWFLWQFLPELGQVVDILAYGNEKYPAEDGCNWRNVPQSDRRYSSALMRHLSAYLEGEKNDAETGKSHLAHLITNALFLMWFDRNETKGNS